MNNRKRKGEAVMLAMATPHADAATLRAHEHKGTFAYCPNCKGTVESVCWGFKWQWLHVCANKRPKVTKR